MCGRNLTNARAISLSTIYIQHEKTKRRKYVVPVWLEKEIDRVAIFWQQLNLTRKIVRHFESTRFFWWLWILSSGLAIELCQGQSVAEFNGKAADQS